MRKVIKENMGWVITIISFVIVVIVNVVALSYYFGKIDERMQNISDQNKIISSKIDSKLSIDTHNVIEENNRKDHDLIRQDIANLNNSVKIYNDNVVRKIDEHDRQLNSLKTDVAIIKSKERIN
jgi:hypothetical protein